MISTNKSGAASFASHVARVGKASAGAHSAQTLFIQQHFSEETKDGEEEEGDEEEELKFNDLEFDTDVDKKILQVRFSSNEIYLYDVEKGEFSEYFLFKNRELTIPFIIFNNCASIFVKNKVFFDRCRASKRSIGIFLV